MDRVTARQVMQATGVPVVPYLAIHRREWKRRQGELMAEMVKRFRPPYFVKPARHGSFVRSERVDISDHLPAAIQKALTMDEKILVEQGIAGRRIEFAVFGNEEISIPPPGEVLSRGGLGCSCGRERSVIHSASLNEEQREQGGAYAHKVFQALDCTGMTSVAFFLDEGGRWFFNEAAPLPLMGGASLYAAIWKEQGVAYPELMHRLIILALSRFRRAQCQIAHTV